MMTLLTSLLPAVLKGGIKLFQGRQKRREAAQEIKASWELAQTEKYPWFVSLFAVAHIVGPIDYSFYVAYQAAAPIESPEEMAHVVKTTLDAFPIWWTGAFITLILAMAGIRANGQEKVNQSRAKAIEHKRESERNRTEAAKHLTEAAKHLQKRKAEQPRNLP